MRRIVLAALLVLSTLAALPVSTANADCDLVGATNALRASHGLAPLDVNGNLSAKASGWAAHMASTGTLSHSSLSSGISVPWSRLGENVGMGPSLCAVQQAFVASPVHYRNLTDPGFRYVGVGVVSSNGTLFVAVEFMQPASQPAPSTSANAAGTPSSRSATRSHSSRSGAAPRIITSSATIMIDVPGRTAAG